MQKDKKITWHYYRNCSYYRRVFVIFKVQIFSLRKRKQETGYWSKKKKDKFKSIHEPLIKGLNIQNLQRSKHKTITSGTYLSLRNRCISLGRRSHQILYFFCCVCVVYLKFACEAYFLCIYFPRNIVFVPFNFSETKQHLTITILSLPKLYIFLYISSPKEIVLSCYMRLKQLCIYISCTTLSL